MSEETKSPEAQVIPAEVGKSLDRVEKAAQVATKAEGAWMGKREALVEAISKAKDAGATREQVEARLQGTGLSETSVKDVLLKGGFRKRAERSDKGKAKAKAKVVKQELGPADGDDGETEDSDSLIGGGTPQALAQAIVAKRGMVGARAVMAALMEVINTSAKGDGKSPKLPRKAAHA